MKNKNTDSTSNLSRFARDKRQRINSSERVERSPRPRREADNEGKKEYEKAMLLSIYQSLFNAGKISFEQLKYLENMNRKYW